MANESPVTRRFDNSINPQPLLSEDKDTQAPAMLGGSAQQPSDLEQSPLERLIAQSTSEQAAEAAAAAASASHSHSLSPFFIQNGSAPNRYFTDNSHNNNNHNNMTHVSSGRATLGTTLATLLAGTFCLLQIALVWSSFLSDVWFDTHLIVTVDSSSSSSSSSNAQEASESLLGLGFSNDQTLKQTTLASLLSMLLEADQHWAAMALVLTGLMFPCLCMVLTTSWTIGDFQLATSTTNTRRRRQAASAADLLGFSPRAFAEYWILRITFLAFFLLAILDVGTSSLALEHNHTQFLIANRTRGGLVCYTLGMSCALAAVVVLRMASSQSSRSTTATMAATPISSPRFPFETAAATTTTTTTSIGRTGQVPPFNDIDLENLHRPLLADESTNADPDRMVIGRRLIDVSNDSMKDLSFSQKVLVYEFGILATVLWMPALVSPLFQITFGGLVASFMEEVSFVIPFYQLPFVLWQRGTVAGTDHWILVALGLVLVLLVYLLPLLAAGTAIGAWRASPDARSRWRCRAFLRLLQPCLCGVVFSLSLLMAVPTFEPLGDYLLDMETSGFCQRFETMTDTACLIIRGEHCLGQWFLLAQSISLEIFVLLTLAWTKY